MFIDFPWKKWGHSHIARLVEQSGPALPRLDQRQLEVADGTFF
jgi:hypothetical protein